jgi:hypothetical protein
MPATATLAGVRAPTFLVAAAVLLAAAGCAVTKDTGRPFPSEARTRLVLDRTTAREAEKLLGPPVTTDTDAAGAERWTYEHTRVSALRAVPFGRRVTVSQTPYERLVLTFRNGRLSECAYLVERYRTEHDVIVATGAERQTCAQPQ